MKAEEFQKWYYVVTCPATGKVFEVAEAITPKDVQPPHPTDMTSTCPHCGAVHEFHAAAVHLTLTKPSA